MEWEGNRIHKLYLCQWAGGCKAKNAVLLVRVWINDLGKAQIHNYGLPLLLCFLMLLNRFILFTGSADFQFSLKGKSVMVLL